MQPPTRYRASTGSDDFAQIRREGLAYVDKTQLIADLLEDGARSILIPRPRRFGKTTNLSMLRYFFERPPAGEDRSDLFEDLGIWAIPEARVHFARHPVIALSLKEVKAANWEGARGAIREILADCVAEHRGLLTHPEVADDEREVLDALIRRRAPPEQIERTLLILARLLHRVSGETVVILIDEYDTPIHSGWLGGYYREVVDFFRVFLGAGLKGGNHLFKAVLTGILRVAQESIFSDLNHLAVYTMLRERYSTAFGFTEDEVRVLAERAGASAHLGDIRRWYNGYRFGSTTIYNPWSVINFLGSEDWVPRPYWINTSSNALIGEVITTGQEALSRELEHLLNGGKVRKRVEEGLALPDLHHDVDTVWGLLLYSGYLKAATVHRDGDITLMIPNREILSGYDVLLDRWMRSSLGGSPEISQLLSAMLQGDVAAFEAALSVLVVTALSVHDVGQRDPERVYHAFTLGLLVQLRATHRVESNPESGHGRADVLVLPRRPGRAGVVLEFKRLGDETPERALDAAMEQIQQRDYATRLRDAGATPIRSYGVVFDGKRVRVRAG